MKRQICMLGLVMAVSFFTACGNAQTQDTVTVEGTAEETKDATVDDKDETGKNTDAPEGKQAIYLLDCSKFDASMEPSAVISEEALSSNVDITFPTTFEEVGELVTGQDKLVLDWNHVEDVASEVVEADDIKNCFVGYDAGETYLNATGISFNFYNMTEENVPLQQCIDNGWYEIECAVDRLSGYQEYFEGSYDSFGYETYPWVLETYGQPSGAMLSASVGSESIGMLGQLYLLIYDYGDYKMVYSFTDYTNSKYAEQYGPHTINCIVGDADASYYTNEMYELIMQNYLDEFEWEVKVGETL